MKFTEFKSKMERALEGNTPEKRRALNELFLLVSRELPVLQATAAPATTTGTHQGPDKFSTAPPLMTDEYNTALSKAIQKHKVALQLGDINDDAEFQLSDTPLPTKDEMSVFEGWIIEQHFTKSKEPAAPAPSYIDDLVSKTAKILEKEQAEFKAVKAKQEEQQRTSASASAPIAIDTQELDSKQNRLDGIKNVSESLCDIQTKHRAVRTAKEALDKALDKLLKNLSEANVKLKNDSTSSANVTAVKTAKMALTDKYQTEYAKTTIGLEATEKALQASINTYNALPAASITVTGYDPGKQATTIVERGTSGITGYTHDVISKIDFSREGTSHDDNSGTSIAATWTTTELVAESLEGGRMARAYQEYAIDSKGTTPKAIALRDEKGVVTDHSVNLSTTQKKAHALEMAKLFAKEYRGGPIIISGGTDALTAGLTQQALECIFETLGKKVEIQNYVPNACVNLAFFKAARKSEAEKLFGTTLLNAALMDVASTPIATRTPELTKKELQELKGKGRCLDDGLMVGEPVTRIEPPKI